MSEAVLIMKEKGKFMVKKFLNGLVFGAGFGIAFLIVVVIYFQFFFQSMVESKVSSFSSNEIIGTPPKVSIKKEYLGSPGTYSGDFSIGNSTVLSSGLGTITGEAFSNKKPLSGLKIRLALNGSVKSQWATTDTEGKYIISVPYGEYRIDGFELDRDAANSVLAGKIMSPNYASSSGLFNVTANSTGRGLTFNFVDPVEKIISKIKYSVSEDIIINWSSHSGASNYQVQVFEKSDPYAYIGNNTVFDWRHRPTVLDTSFDLKKHGIKLKPNHYYSIEIKALDDKMRVLSESYQTHNGYDFEVTD